MQGFFEFLSKKLSLLRTFVHGRFIAPAHPLKKKKKIAPPLSFFSVVFSSQRKIVLFFGIRSLKIETFPVKYFYRIFPE
mgnify:FL=1